MNEDVTAVNSQFENAFSGSSGDSSEVQQRQMKQHAVFVQSPGGVRPVTVVAGNEENPPQKKIKLETDGGLEDLSVLKRRILDHKYMRLRALKEKYSEHVAELFFLQTGGNMMEYPVWRKKPQTPQFITFSRQHRLDQSQLDDLAISSQSPLGTEVKIVGIGATPIAVSTQLPAAVAQLANREHGGTPIVPDGDRRVRTDSTTTHINGVPAATNGPSDQFSVKAKQEVYVMQRIAELQREGLWSEKRLPKLQEPQRPKAHWDYLLEEMSWLAADFAQERKWKKAAAKKCARMVQKYFQDKAIAAQKAEKAQEMQLKRIAAMLAKEVKVFWSNVEKLVEFKQQTRLDEKRKKALDQQLSFIVDQTERYSQQLAVGMNKPLVDRSSKANSLQSSRISSPQRSLGSDDEFKPTEDSSDDETTIAQAEKEAAGTSEEIAALQKESQMDFDDFIKHLPPNYIENRDKIQLSEKGESSDSDVDKDFNADEPSEDDEDTIQEQERTERNTDHKKEIAELEADNELTVEQLRAKYGASSPMELSDEGDSTPSDMSESGADEKEAEESEAENTEEEEEEEEPESGLQSLLKEDQDNDELLNDAAAIAESIQPKGNTLSSTSVVTPIPFLLKHTLREYQHIGLDWLVTMHDRKLNGILADEMGLGKTIQTISLLAHLACEMGNWGPHLIIVPSSVMLNWEMEFKKWCPGFKILTYYGSQKERKLKRIGWTKANAFHVCITSYKLVIQDHQSFRRKKWKYLILDEAQNIKNFKSQRWQLLLNFQTEQRLLLTGTPLQNNLMELWSLMHFLMPHVFQSHREFKEWFSNPVTGMIEGNSEYNESIIKRLHKVLRPFLLRRLKCEVEKQMPKKYEHVLMCRLSKRQRYLYDDFMSRAKTRETLESGNFLSVINVLMQLRKVCNHPNLFETRQTISPFRMDQIVYRTSSLVCDCLDYDPFKNVDLRALNLLLVELEFCLTAYVAHRARKLAPPRKLIEEIDTAPESPPSCPTSKLRMYVRIKNTRVSNTISSGVRVGTSPVMKGNVPMKPQQHRSSLTKPLAAALVEQLKHHSYSTPQPEPQTEVSTQLATEFYVARIDESRKTHRSQALIQLARQNARACDANPIYGEDLRTSLSNIDDVSVSAPFITVGYGNCRKFLRTRDWMCSQSVKTLEERTREMKPVFDNFVLFVPAVCAPSPNIYISHHNPSKRLQQINREEVIRHELSEKMTMLHPIVSAMSTKFPDPRLIQYDCGKLQTLDRLLKQLKDGGHRVLIFTQMTRMLDVLEAFLNYHGHIYLRLDGTTKVEQRQVYMERFNNDKRIFAFILSTRSGGVGVNLTGADTVIFYDSDWNPTMDAQAQDRCHRIGQTRDVHIYRLVSERTIEENILKKANQKRLLGDLAIEGGNFTTAYFKSTTIQDLFNVDANEGDASARLAEIVDRDRERNEDVAAGSSKNAIGVFETALAQAEDDQDVQAAKTAKDEAAAEMDEFDENIPIVEEVSREPELSKGEREIQGIISQLNPIEKYAMKFVEDTLETWTAVQLEAVEKEIEQQKREWEANRLAELAREEEERKRMEAEENDIITYSRDDAKNQVWISLLTEELMPMWCPPTPPQDDNDVYIDHSLGFLYEQEIIPEDLLPAIYIKREYKRSRLEAGFFTDGRRNIKMRKEDHFYAPRSLFDRNATQMVKMRRDLKLQRFRNFYRSPVQIAGGLKQQQNPVKQLNEPEGMVEWSIYEDMIILNIIENFQFLPPNLTLINTGHTPNWDLVAEMVNQTSRTYRSPKQCRYRYEAVIVPREEGKYIESPKKQKKNKLMKNSPMKSSRMRTSQLFSSDKNNSFVKYARIKFENMKGASIGKSQATKQVLVNPSMKNPKQAAVLAEMGINCFEGPLTPQEIATKRVERITKEKQKTAMQQNQEMSTVPSTSSQPQVIQVQTPSSGQQQTVQQIVVQQSTPVTAIVQSNQIQVSRTQSAVVQSPQQIVKAIVATTPGQPLMTQQMLAERQQQLQQVSQGTIINPNSVSVVLSSPVTTVSNVQVGTPQIVSIGQSVVASSSAIVSQSGSIIQTITSQPSQVVSVAQLATIGVSGISTSTTQRAGTQRIMTASTLQDIVLQQRQAGSQSPTVVSVSNLNPSQLSAMRLNVTGQPVPGVLATKTIPVVTAGAGKPGQIYYRQPIRQQLKVMHTGTGQTGQTLVGPGGIVTNIQGIQGQTVQMQGGQKVAVAGGSTTTSVATVQMTGAQPRFVEPVGGKQLTRQVGDGEMPTVMVKKPMIGHKQMLPQTQIYTQNVQVQQGSSNQPQVATLIKASAALTGPLAQVKAAQIKTQLNQVRQIQLHPQVQISQQRKGGKVTQIAQLGKSALPTQLIVNSKNIPGTVTVQQIQPVYRHANPGQLASGQIMLGKSRMIPVSVAQQPNQRPTIQVVTGTPNVRAHVATTQNIQGVLQGAIKVAPPQQQAILTALQNSNQRSNASPVRLQTGGPLVAVTVQQSPNNSQSAQSSLQEVSSGTGGGGQQANTSGQQSQQK